LHDDQDQDLKKDHGCNPEEGNLMRHRARAKPCPAKRALPG
jgi:hypothetical protein